MKLNIDNLPQISNSLNVKNIPAVFLIYQGNIIDQFVGIPSDTMLTEFIGTAVAIDQLSHDESVISDLISKAEDYIKNNDIETAFKILSDGY